MTRRGPELEDTRLRGHTMILFALDGDLFLTLAQPNVSPRERALVKRLAVHADDLVVQP